MKITKCQNDHYFDSDKFVYCPHCANQMAEVAVEDLLGKSQKKIDTVIPSLNNTNRNHCKTVGWLVCIDGAMIGESFILREGDNYIGRAGNMDIALLHEPSVSREKHALITYETEKKTFHLYSPNQSGQILCNHKTVKIKRKLKNRDVITLGDCVLLFVALCSSSFTWENILTKQITHDMR